MSTVFYKKLITFFKLFLTHIWFEKEVTNDKAPNLADGSVLCFIKNEGYNVNLFFDYIEEGRTMYWNGCGSISLVRLYYIPKIQFCCYRKLKGFCWLCENSLYFSPFSYLLCTLKLEMYINSHLIIRVPLGCESF